MAVERLAGPTDENRAPRGDPGTVVEEKWDQGEVDRMQSFGVPAVEPGWAPAQQRRTPHTAHSSHCLLYTSDAADE